MSNVCEHGQLARSCNICELLEEIEQLRAEVEKAESKGFRKGLLRAAEIVKGYYKFIYVEPNGTGETSSVAFKSFADDAIREEINRFGDEHQ